MKGIFEKLSIKEGCRSAVMPGHDAIGVLHRGFRVDGKHTVAKCENLGDISEGDMLAIYNNPSDFLKCSEVVSILELSENSVTVETFTSIYKFTKVP